MHDTMTVTSPGPSRDAGWGNENGFGDYNGGGSSGGSSRSAGYAVAALSMVRPGISALVFPFNGVLSATLNIGGSLDTGFMNLGNYIDTAKPFATRMSTIAMNTAVIKGAARFAGPVAGIASLVMTLEEGRQEAVERLQRELIEKARKEAERVSIKDVYQIMALPVTTMFVASFAREQINAIIREQSNVVTDVVAQLVVDTKTQQSQMAITRSLTNVPIVKAEKTHKSNVYSAQVVTGMKPMQIRVDNSVSWSTQKKTA